MPLRFSAAKRKTARKIGNRPAGSRSTCVSFSRGLFLVVQCGMHCVPREGGTFHTHGKLAYAREYLQIAEVIGRTFFIQFTGNHGMKLAEEFLRLLLALSLHRLGHHARRSFGNRAPGTFEAYILHGLVFQIQIHHQMIATEWIEPLGRVVRHLEPAKIPWLLIVIKNDLLIEFA